jgi:hypothetical protein
MGGKEKTRKLGRNVRVKSRPNKIAAEQQLERLVWTILQMSLVDFHGFHILRTWPSRQT